MRPEAQAIAGWYPTPPEFMPAIAALCTRGPADSYVLLDPCAGDGEAVVAFGKAVLGVDWKWTTVYAVELEASRYSKLKARAKTASDFDREHRLQALHGDAFTVEWSFKAERYGSPEHEGPSAMLLNSPYHEGIYERRFLERFTGALRPGAVLVMLVPYTALADCAAALAQHYDVTACYRFPEPLFSQDPDRAFKQVVLYAVRRTSLLEPDVRVVEQLMAWSEDATLLPVLPEAGTAAPIVTLPGFDHHAGGYAEWKLRPLDIPGTLAAFQPFHATERSGAVKPIAGLLPPAEVADMLTRVFPVATPLKPAYIATAIAAGAFKGERITPDDPEAGWPDLLVKGSFDRAFTEVDEKTNKDGEKTASIKIQQPQLRVTVLDLRTRRYHTLEDSAEESAATTVDGMTIADLLAIYGQSLLQVMLKNCPVLHDPANDTHAIPIAAHARPLYEAQRQAVMAMLKVLAENGNVVVLGEVGSGKSACAIVAAATLAASVLARGGTYRALVFCPPHLLKSWRDQVAAVMPSARVVVLEDVADVDALAADPTPGLTFAVLSRETAKLGHARAGVGATCPRCEAPTPKPAKATADAREELARKRARCEAQATRPGDAAARAAHDLAVVLYPVYPHAAEVQQLLRGRAMRRALDAAAARMPSPDARRAVVDETLTTAWAARRRDPRLYRVLDAAVATVCTAKLDTDRKQAGRAVEALLAAMVDHDATVRAARRIYEASADDKEVYGRGADQRTLARGLLHLLPLDGADQRRAEVALRSLGMSDKSAYYSGAGNNLSGWERWEAQKRKLLDGEGFPHTRDAAIGATAGRVQWDGHDLGDGRAAVKALGLLTAVGTWATGPACGEHLYQATPAPRRFPLARYIAKRHRRLFDLLITDESQELAADGSAQALAAYRLAGLGMPVIDLTGSAMGGYAEGLYNRQVALDARFREEFPRGHDGQRQAFVRTYGFIKVLEQDVDRGTGKVVAYGSVSDRVERQTRTLGNAPGVLSLFVLRYLLRIGVVLHKADLKQNLKPCREIPVSIAAGPELTARAVAIAKVLEKQIKKDRWDKLLAGKLWGAMARFVDYADLATADTGNAAGGAWEVRYPNNPELGVYAGRVLHRVEAFPADTVLPKEQWMLDTVRAELAEGRRCMVLATQVELLPRLRRLLETALGERVLHLDAKKVPTEKREEWIDREVVAKGVRVLVVNPVAVQTGLNPLVHFATEIWMQNPTCNAIIFRQAVGRVDRIGQQLETRIYLPCYTLPAPDAAMSLLMHKVAVSLATDGLDAAGALEAAGVGGGERVDGFAVGKAIFALMSGEKTLRPRRQAAAVAPAKPRRSKLPAAA